MQPDRVDVHEGLRRYRTLVQTFIANPLPEAERDGNDATPKSLAAREVFTARLCAAIEELIANSEPCADGSRGPIEASLVFAMGQCGILYGAVLSTGKDGDQTAALIGVAKDFHDYVDSGWGLADEIVSASQQVKS